MKKHEQDRFAFDPTPVVGDDLELLKFQVPLESNPRAIELVQKMENPLAGVALSGTVELKVD